MKKILLILLVILPTMLGAQVQVQDAPVPWGHSSCPEPGDTRNNVCLQGGLFEVEVHGTGTQGRPTGFDLTSTTSVWYYYQPENLELLVKVLNGCSENGYWWVLIGGVTDQYLHISVRDLQDPKQPLKLDWVHQAGTPLSGVVNTQAFPCRAGIYP